MNMVVLFTKSQLQNLIDFIEFEFIDTIRRDEDIDNIDYIVDMMCALKSMREAYKQACEQEAEASAVHSPYKDCAMFLDTPGQ